MATNIRSNMVRGEYMRDIVDRTIREIHDDLATVFGPFATDAYIMQGGNTYYTRDGKENVRSMQFDNALAEYVLKILFQAICDQAEKVGDGTTTMGVFYTNLYQMMRANSADIRLDRDTWNLAVAQVNNEIRAQKQSMTEDDLLQMLFTCTQDAELSSKIYTKLKDAIMANAYVVITKSNIASDFNVTVSTNPMIKAYRQFSLRPVQKVEPACTILHCNGVLDISHVDVLLSMIARVPVSGPDDNPTYYPKTIVLLCNGISEGTRVALKEVIQRMNSIKNSGGRIENYNNLAIYTLRDYRSYTPDQLEDLSTIITDEYGIGGLVHQLTFESTLYQAMRAQNIAQTEDGSPPDEGIAELNRFDADMHHIMRMQEMLDDRYEVEFDEIEGIRIKKPLGPIAQRRYDELRQQIRDEKVPINRINLNKRLRSMYGQFIEVEVGSRLLKDSQRKYELILDAVLAAGQGVEFGVLRANSILVAIRAADTLYEKHLTYPNDPFVMQFKLIRDALVKTIYDMVSPVYNAGSGDDALEFLLGLIKNGRLGDFDLKRGNTLQEALPSMDTEEKAPSRKHTINLIAETEDEEDQTIEFTEQIIEPVSVITTILQNSTMMLELATARSFHLSDWCNNYID